MGEGRITGCTDEGIRTTQHGTISSSALRGYLITGHQKPSQSAEAHIWCEGHNGSPSQAKFNLMPDHTTADIMRKHTMLGNWLAPIHCCAQQVLTRAAQLKCSDN